MSTAMSTFVFRMIVFVVVAWIVYAFDRRFGRNSYRTWYDLSHEDKLQPDVVRGFVCGRSGKTQCTMAILLSIVVTIGLATFSQDTALTWFFTFMFGVVATLFGFITGPLVSNLLGKRDKVFTAIDRLEAGEINPAKSVWQGSRELRSRFSRLFDWFGRFWNGPSAAVSPTSAPKTPSDPDDALAVPDDELILKEPSDTASQGLDRSAEGGAGEAKKELTPEEKIRQFTGR